MDMAWLLLPIVFGYMFPTIIAWANKHRNSAAIAALNVLLGWTLIGWVVALVWALTKPREIVVHMGAAPQVSGQAAGIHSTQAAIAPSRIDSEEVHRLVKMREQGLLSETDFEREVRGIKRSAQ